MMTFVGSGPSAATIPSARRIAGNAKNTSMTRPTTRSAIPPRYPETSPRTPPTLVAAVTERTATCIERRAPNSTRLKRSRPSASVPKGNAALGPARRSADTCNGSRSGRTPTVRAMAAYAATIASPAMATGSRAIVASRPGRTTAKPAVVLREADSGIQVAIQKVHNDVERDEEDRDREHSALNERVIALHDRGEEQSTNSWNGEDLLHDDGASEKLTDLDPEQRDHHDQPVLEDVTPHHDRRSQALRPRGADVIGAEHVEDRRARHTHRRGRER